MNSEGGGVSRPVVSEIYKGNLTNEKMVGVTQSEESLIV